MRGSLSRCTTLSRRRARRPDSRIRRYNFLPAEGPVPVSALVIGNTDTFSSGTPPYSGGGGYSYASAGIPHPARAFGKGYSYTSTGTPTPPAPAALLPRPLPGQGPCVVISGGAAVPGSSPGSPHVLDRGDIATGGWRLAGRGNSFPLPCLSRSQDPAHLTDSTRISAGRLPMHFCRPPPAREGREQHPCPRETAGYRESPQQV